MVEWIKGTLAGVLACSPKMGNITVIGFIGISLLINNELKDPCR